MSYGQKRRITPKNILVLVPMKMSYSIFSTIKLTIILRYGEIKYDSSPAFGKILNTKTYYNYNPIDHDFYKLALEYHLS